MKAAADKTPEHKTQITANGATQAPDGGDGLAQFTDNRPETTQLQQLQGMADQSTQVGSIGQLQAMANGPKSREVVLKLKNNTGLPDNLKIGIASLSGMSMDDVKGHCNSDKPAQLKAHAYAQGSEIHQGSGQEKHLLHEAWHVVRQKQGRVKPTMQKKGKVNVNNDARLEKEADMMGNKAQFLDNGQLVPHSGTTTQLLNSDNKFYEDVGLILQAKWAFGVAQFVLFDGVDIKYSQENEQILKDALDAILEVQENSNGFLEWCEELIEKTDADGVPAHWQEISAFYESTKEAWFSVNPILREAWDRCIASTRKIANKSKYHKVGGKFKRKLEQLLVEIEEDFIALSDEVDNVQAAYINKEHIENKGLGGPQVQNDNLMDAGVGPKGLGMGNGTLSEFHIALHRLKSQGGNLFNSMDVDIRSIIQSVKGASTGDEMGTFN